MNTTLRMRISYRSGTSSAPLPSPLEVSSETQELIAKIAGQKRALIRQRRLKRTVWAVGAVGALVTFMVVRHHRAPVGAAPIVAQAAHAPAPAPVVPAPVAAPAATPAIPAAALAREACDRDFSERRWRAAVDSCVSAFEAEASAPVALKIAQANWSRGQVNQAGAWATRAVSLGSEDADAYVLIGHAEREAGHLKSAMTAYRHYLHASPHGWHAAHVRASLRELKSKTALGDTTAASL